MQISCANSCANLLARYEVFKEFVLFINCGRIFSPQRLNCKVGQAEKYGIVLATLVTGAGAFQVKMYIQGLRAGIFVMGENQFLELSRLLV